MSQSSEPRVWRWLYWGSFGLIVLGFLCACLYEIAGPWRWGHNGYNGAAFMHAARNALRFGIVGQAQYYMGLEPPEPTMLYTHHPLLLHAHLVLNVALGGAREVMGRLVPAAYSMGMLLMIFAMGRRFLGRAEGLVAAAIFALTPLHLICANMINHEQGGIFWALVMLYAYLRWCEAPSAKRAVWTLVATSCAAQFDWPAYYMAFMMALHLGAWGLKGVRVEGRWRWPKPWTLLLIFSAVVLANFFGFFAWIAHTRGSIDNMVRAFTLRTSEPAHYWEHILAREDALHGDHLVALLLIWMVWSLVRLVRGKARLIELVPWIFAASQAIHSTVFKHAGIIHAYWVYYLGPALALGGAMVLVDAWRLIKGRVPRLPQWLPWVIGAIMLLGQSVIAARQWRWGVDSGHVSYVGGYNDQHTQVQLLKWVAAPRERETTTYLLDPALHSRIEQHYYLDAPHAVSGPRRLQVRDGVSEVLVVDLARARHPALLRQLAERHGARVLDERYAVFSADGEAGQVTLWQTRILPNPWWWWMVSGAHPRQVIEPVALTSAQAMARVFGAPGATGREVGWMGGKGGWMTGWRCGPSQAMTALEVQRSRGGNLIAAARVWCQPVAPSDADAVASGAAVAASAPRPGLWMGNYNPSSHAPQRLACEAGEVPVGVFGRSGMVIDAIGLICASPDGKTTRRTDLIGGGGGFEGELMCPPGGVMNGLHGRTGALVDAVALACWSAAPGP